MKSFADPTAVSHPRQDRRFALQIGAVGLVGLGTNHLTAFRERSARAETRVSSASNPSRTLIYIFLSGGLAQHDSFDLKPDAPDNIRGEFQPIATRTPGIEICEHLPLLAQRSHLWSLCRSLSHHSNDHTAAHQMMLTGRTVLPPGFSANGPMPTDWPSIAAIGGILTPPRNHLPTAAVLPDKLVHYSRRVLPGQFAGLMGSRRDPWFIEASPFSKQSYGAYPEFEFDHEERPNMPRRTAFQAPDLTLPEDFSRDRLRHRLQLLKHVDSQRADLERIAGIEEFDRHQQGAISFLTNSRLREAIDVTLARPETQDRYGRNSFGWSLLMARRLVEAGVNLIQVNLGNNETWDTHGEAFPHLKEKLFPPMDRAVSALLDDLQQSGLLESTLVVMAGEFGRTPKISHLPQFYKLPGRDHWGPVQSVFFAGGGIQGGRVVGSSDKIGAYPLANLCRPENMAATIYQSLGLPDTAAWLDELNRPHHIYHGEPIADLT